MVREKRNPVQVVAEKLGAVFLTCKQCGRRFNARHPHFTTVIDYETANGGYSVIAAGGDDGLCSQECVDSYQTAEDEFVVPFDPDWMIEGKR